MGPIAAMLAERSATASKRPRAAPCSISLAAAGPQRDPGPGGSRLPIEAMGWPLRVGKSAAGDTPAAERHANSRIRRRFLINHPDIALGAAGPARRQRCCSAPLTRGAR